MKLYHGSPKKLGIIRPSKKKHTKSGKEFLEKLFGVKKARKIIQFENKNAVFLASNFKHAAFYALGKSLRKKTIFAITQDKLVVIGDFKPSAGYVHEMEIEESNKLKKLTVKKYEEFSLAEDIKPSKIYKVKPKDFQKNIVRVKDKDELLQVLKRA